MNLIITASNSFQKLPRRPGRGFVLIEVLVSLTVFAVGIMAVLTAVLAALDLQKDSALRYRAGLILQEKLAETVLVPYDGQPVRGISPEGEFSWTVASEPWTGMPQAGSRKTTITRKSRAEQKDGEANPAEIAAQLVLVTVEVNWLTNRGPRNLLATQLVHLSPEAGGAP